MDEMTEKQEEATRIIEAIGTTTFVVHTHPIVEMQIKNFKKDEVGYIAECVLYNKESKEVESSFFVDEDRANEIIVLMETFLNNCG
jgi:hypothetical protein